MAAAPHAQEPVEPRRGLYMELAPDTVTKQQPIPRLLQPWDQTCLASSPPALLGSITTIHGQGQLPAAYVQLPNRQTPVGGEAG